VPGPRRQLDSVAQAKASAHPLETVMHCARAQVNRVTDLTLRPPERGERDHAIVLTKDRRIDGAMECRTSECCGVSKISGHTQNHRSAHGSEQKFAKRDRRDETVHDRL
jgi:hypothetical protein